MVLICIPLLTHVVDILYVGLPFMCPIVLEDLFICHFFFYWVICNFLTNSQAFFF